MDRRHRITQGTFALALLVAPAMLAIGRPAAAQAWVAPAGVGSLSVAFQRIDNTGHLVTDGSLDESGKSTNAAVYVEVEYAISDRISLAGGLPYVFAKYVGPGETPLIFLPVDSCFCWHGGWQDFGFTARYNLLNNAFGVTPSVSLGVPSHDYNYRGEAAIGRNLREFRMSIDAGYRLDAISPKLSVQGRYAYALVERVLDIPNNRSNAAVESSFLVSRKLSVRGFVSWQRTHGGLRFGVPHLDFPREVNTAERLAQHDRLLRDNNWRGGGGISYSFPRLDVFASYIHYISGTDSHAGRVFTGGISWPFQIGSGHIP